MPPPPPLHHHRHRHSPLLPILLSSIILLLFLFLTFLFLLGKRLSLSGSRSRSRTTPSSSFPHHHHSNLHRFSFSLLRLATSNFSPSSLLGHGGFGSVHKGSLPSHPSLAIKLMHSPSSPQSSIEFQNELSLASSLRSPHILSLLGFSSSRSGHHLALVYQLMLNKSLQDALLDRKCGELMEWKRRFKIASDVARGLEYLHHMCDPPVIHGDVKPSNILLDENFSARIGDFGLAKFKTSQNVVVGAADNDGGVKDNGSILEETESVASGADQSPESCVIRVLDSEPSPEAFSDKISVDSAKDSIAGGGGRRKGGSGRDWWWKQDNEGGSESGREKDYVMAWIGSQIKQETPTSELVESIEFPRLVENNEKKNNRKKEKNRTPREWWKEEFCEELAKKNNKKRELNSINAGEMWSQKDEESGQVKKKKKKSRGSIDRWFDNFSSELKNGFRISQDLAAGDIPKSGGISSTPSMRGTVCYIAPEYGGGGQLSEKCDVYSYGVLLLVLISGRRPLQVTGSPISEFERANLISWARQSACNGRLLELIDPDIQSLDKEQALLCITIALLCLQRSPEKRPTMEEIVGMLSGEAEPPHLHLDFSPSPPLSSNFAFKSWKKVPGVG